MVAFGAIYAGLRNARRRQRMAAAGERRRKAAQRHRETRERIDTALDAIFMKYDTDHSGNLSREEVAAIMTDLDSTTPAGQLPSEEEIDFVLQESAGEDHLVHREDLGQMIVLWSSFVNDKKIVNEAWDRHDTEGTGSMGEKQLHSLLVELNDGEEVDSEEVRMLIGLFDAEGTGDLKRGEVIKAVHCWFVEAEERERRLSSLDVRRNSGDRRGSLERRRSSFDKRRSSADGGRGGAGGGGGGGGSGGGGGKKNESVCCAIA